jgi:hypothetical protein
MQRQARILFAVAAFGLAASLAIGVVGSALLATASASLGDSLTLTRATVAAVSEGLGDLDGTVRSLEPSLVAGGTVLSSAADLSGGNLADSIDAVNASLPGLERAAVAVDLALTTFGQLPLTPDYDPQQPLDESVRQLEASLTGVPQQLRDNAVLLDQASAGMTEAGRATGTLAADLERVQGGLDEAEAQLMARSDELRRRTALGHLAIWILAATLAFGQVVPLLLGRELRR